MWILPKNYPLSSVFVADMVESKEDLSLKGLNIESSLMWRSKPTRLQTWLQRWNRISWMPHLFTRILKPSHQKSFEIKLASSLEAIPVNRSALPALDKERKIQDTFGLTSDDTLMQLDLFNVSSKTSKDTYRLDSPQLSATWQKIITEQRGEYSQRRKLALLTEENESTSWLTPRAMEVDESYENYQKRMKKSGNPKNIGKTKPACLTMQVKMNSPTWATPRTTDAKGGARRLNEKGQRVSVSDPKKTYGANLSDQVKHWPTPRASEYKDCGPVGSKSQIHMNNKSYLCAKVKDPKMPSGHLNPDWVEWLMGVPTGWTELGCWGTESCHKQPQKRGEL